MQCPHCGVLFSPTTNEPIHLGHDSDGDWVVLSFNCTEPTCNKIIITILNGLWVGRPEGGYVQENSTTSYFARPKYIVRPISPLVPLDLAEIFIQACLVLDLSPMASAALSRRCLQQLLRDVAGHKGKTLADEIQMALDSKTLPSHIADDIDAIRKIGNFAAHPIKSTNSGQITNIEPHEAEWNLDVLEALFDFYIVAPEKSKQRRLELNAKLQEAGIPPMK